MVGLATEKFPNLESFIFPSIDAINSRCSFNPQELIKALKACAPMGDSDAKFATTYFNDDGTCDLIADDRRQSKIKINIKGTADKPINLCLASMQFAETLGLMTKPDDEEPIELATTAQATYMQRGSKKAAVAVMKETPTPKK